MQYFYSNSHLDDGRTSDVWPNKSDRFVELQYQTNSNSIGQLHDQARKPTDRTSPVSSTARTRRILQGKRDRRDRVLVFRHEKQPRTNGNELDVI